jgi:predicted Zn-dependent peptidase
MLDRKSPPAFQQNTRFDLLTPEIVILPGNSKMLFINGGDQEVIKLELVFRAGRWYESRPGIAHFTGSLLTKGTSKHTSFQINNTFDFYGVHVELHPGFDFLSVSLYGLTKNIASVLELFIEILTEASFPEQELQQALSIYAQGLKINLEKTSYLASREFRNKLFGEANPYGYDIEFEDINRITRSALVEFREHFLRDFFVLASGKISDELKQQLIESLSQLPYSLITRVQHPLKKQQTLETHIEKTDSVQTSIRVGKFMIDRVHPDYAGVLLLNHLLGGFFGSRLMKNIREEKGLTYGIHSSIHALKEASYAVIGADVNKENRQLTVDEIKKEIHQLQTGLISQEELVTGRNHFIGSLQTEMNTPFAHADKWKVLQMFDLQPDYYQKLINSMLSISPTDIQRIANSHFNSDQLIVVSVG